jgi:hypothetical protein
MIMRGWTNHDEDMQDFSAKALDIIMLRSYIDVICCRKCLYRNARTRVNNVFR